MRRRRYLAAATSVGVSGCLRLEQSDTGGSHTATGTTMDATTTRHDQTSAPSVTVSEAWSFRTAAPVAGVPTADEQLVYVHSSDKRLYALDRKSGEKEWATEVGDVQVKKPTIRDGMVLLESKQGLTGIDSADGSIRWRAPVSGRPIARKPLVSEGLVFSAGKRKLLGLDTDSGNTEWEQTFDGPVFRWGGELRSGRLLLLIESSDGYPKLIHFDPKTGERIEQQTLDIKPEWGRLAVFSVTDSRIVLDMYRNAIEGFDRDSGERVWAVSHKEGATPHYRLSEEKLFVKSLFEDHGGLIALDAREGRLLWEYETSGVCCYASPVLRGDTLIGANTGSNRPLAGFDAASGDLRWKYTSDFTVEGGINVQQDALFVGGSDARIYRLEATRR